MSARGTIALGLRHLERHFTGVEVIGLHASDGTSSRWFGFDFDAHEGGDARLASNVADVARLVDELRARGFTPLVEDSDGRGGLHVWCILDEAAPTEDVFHLAHTLCVTLTLACETFPKQAYIAPGGLGNWLRLPGQHHTRAHWSRIAHDGRWLAGADAVTALLAHPLSSASLVPVAPTVSGAVAQTSVFLSSAPLRLPTDRERVIRKYVAKVPHGGAGSNRSGRAFHLARFLRALEVGDAEALAVLAWWNAGNTPPLADTKLEQVWRNAAKYNTRPLTLEVVA